MSPRSHLSTREKQDEPSTSSCSLLSRKGYHSLCPRLIIWNRRSPVTSSRHGSTKATAYASRSLTSTEQRYAQIEKEVLAPTWACEKFADYILGKELKIKTDHKPLIPLLASKCLPRPASQDSKIPDASHALYIPSVEKTSLVKWSS